MQVTLAQLAELTGTVVHRGDPTWVCTGFAALKEATSGDCTFYAGEKFLPDLRSTTAGVVIAAAEESVPAACAVLIAAEPAAVFSSLVAKFSPPPAVYRPGVHASAIIAPGVVLDPAKVSIGPLVVVEAGARIGEGTTIGAGSFIGEGAKIGRDCVLQAHVTVYRHCEVGDRVRLHSGVVIGSDGFGYEFRDGVHQKVEQVGIVQIDDDVEIGANTTVDRARFGRTHIGKGTKIDNLVQIAHGAKIGQHVIIVSQAGIAGSAVVGDYCIIAAQAGVGGHISISPGIVIAGKSGVTRSLTEKGVYHGYPVQPMQEYSRQQVLVRKLPEMAARIKALEKAADKKP